MAVRAVVGSGRAVFVLHAPRPPPHLQFVYGSCEEWPWGRGVSTGVLTTQVAHLGQDATDRSGFETDDQQLAMIVGLSARERWGTMAPEDCARVHCVSVTAMVGESGRIAVQDISCHDICLHANLNSSAGQGMGESHVRCRSHMIGTQPFCVRLACIGAVLQVGTKSCAPLHKPHCAEALK